MAVQEFFSNDEIKKIKGSMCATGMTCPDLARIHNGGPFGCSAERTEYYGILIGRCLKRLPPYENIDSYDIPV